MSLDKSIKSGKEWRKSRNLPRSCLNHGSCQRCNNGRLHKYRKRQQIAETKTKEWTRYEEV